jgi:LEA14-like dessication related protein
MNRSLALLITAVLGTACTDGGSILDVEFDRLDVNQVSWDEVDTDFVFKVSNPNPIGIQMQRFDYALSFDGLEWVSGDDPDGLQVAAADESEVALPALVGFMDLYEMVQAVRGADDIPFEISGTFGFDTDFGSIDIPYAADGSFPAVRKPTVDFSRIRLDSVDWNGASFEVELEVDNEHLSSLWLSNFDYSLDLEGSSVASGVLDTFELEPVADGASKGIVSIPVEVSFLDVGMGLYDALTSSSADLELNATTDVETPFGIIPMTVERSGSVAIE